MQADTKPKKNTKAQNKKVYKAKEPEKFDFSKPQEPVVEEGFRPKSSQKAVGS